MQAVKLSREQAYERQKPIWEVLRYEMALKSVTTGEQYALSVCQKCPQPIFKNEQVSTAKRKGNTVKLGFQ